MPEPTTSTEPSPATTAGTNTPTTSSPDSGQQQTDLGDAGKRALDEERSARREAERARKALEKELADLRSQSMSDAEKAIAKAKEDGRSEALTVANRRLVTAEVRVAAAGKLADPADAVRFLDLEEFKVDDDGEVDAKAVGKAIDQLIKEKPYLAAGASRVQGSADGGARGNGSQGVDMNTLLRRAAGRQ